MATALLAAHCNVCDSVSFYNTPPPPSGCCSKKHIWTVLTDKNRRAKSDENADDDHSGLFITWPSSSSGYSSAILCPTGSS